MATDKDIPADPSVPAQQADDSFVDPAYTEAEKAWESEQAHKALVAEAAEFMEQPEIESFKDDALLKAAVAAARRAAEKARQQFVSPASAQEADAAPTEQGLDDIVIPPEQDQVDPAAWKAVAALKEIVAKQVRPAGPSVSAVADWMFAQAAADVPEIGTGPTASLPPNSVAAVTRAKVVHEAERIQQEARKAGQAVPSLEEAFHQGIRSVCGASVAAAEQRRKAAQASEREKAISQRPGGERRSLPFGRDRALAALAEHRQRVGTAID